MYAQVTTLIDEIKHIRFCDLLNKKNAVGYMYLMRMLNPLICVREAAHAAHDAQHVVVGSEDLELGGVSLVV